MLDRVVLLGICLLICSITPASALEMGGIESYSVPVTTASGGGDVFGINPVNKGIEGVSTKNRSENNFNNFSSVKKTDSWGTIIIAGVIITLMLLVLLKVFGMIHGAAEAVAGHGIAPGMANMMPATMIMNPAVALNIHPITTPTMAANILSHMNPTFVADILSHMNPTMAANLLSHMNPTFVVNILSIINPTMAANLLSHMNPTFVVNILTHMNPFFLV